MEKRYCAHRGLSALTPENSLPAFAAALALGADEIEFDVRQTKDGKLVVSHDNNLDRISDGQGLVAEHTLAELQQTNIGVKHGWDVPFCTPEEVFAAFAGKLTFNIHMKEQGEDGWMMKEIAALAKKYGNEDSIYIAASPNQLEWAQKVVPHISRCAIQLPRDTIGIYDMSMQYGCERVQFWLGMFDEALIEKLHAAGIRCNLFYADAHEDYDRYFSMGVDTLLTNRMDLAARHKAMRQ